MKTSNIGVIPFLVLFLLASVQSVLSFIVFRVSAIKEWSYEAR